MRFLITLIGYLKLGNWVVVHLYCVRVLIAYKTWKTGPNTACNERSQWRIQLWADRAPPPIDQNLGVVMAARLRHGGKFSLKSLTFGHCPPLANPGFATERSVPVTDTCRCPHGRIGSKLVWPYTLSKGRASYL